MSNPSLSLIAPPLPPGQVLTDKFPLVGELAAAPGLTATSCRIEIGGLVATPLSLSLAELMAMTDAERIVDIHCVTGWSRPRLRLRGWPLATVLARAGVHADARYVRFIAHSLRAHDTSLPLDFALADTWLVHSVDGAPLSAEHGGPIRTVTPSRYFYKSLKWLAKIELMAEDRLGYWERESAYHNEADFRAEQRFDDARVTAPDAVAAFRDAISPHFANDERTVWLVPFGYAGSAAGRRRPAICVAFRPSRAACATPVSPMSIFVSRT